MLRFECDYGEGAAPAVLDLMQRTNFDQTPGYGEDSYCAAAADKIRALCDAPDAAVHFFVGATQANLTVIDAALKPWQGVLCADSGHINGHEAGAVEATGHKLICLPAGRDGKLTPAAVAAAVKEYESPHVVRPGLAYISQATENGAVYTKAELEALSDTCMEHQLLLYVDGARLGYGLVSPGTDVTLRDIARLTTVFYIGGTKVGALCGEAVVFPKGAPEHFFTMVKQQGALLAKGRLLGIQFDVLFTDDLYFSISKNAIATANRLKAGFAAKGYRFFMDSPTNQIFLVLENTQLAALEGKAKFGFWEKYDDTHTVVRIATSWATRMEEVEQLLELM